MCLMSPTGQAHCMRGENTESHPAPPPSLCSHHRSLCVGGCVSERNNTIPQSPSAIVVKGVKGVLEKRRAGWYSGPGGLFLPTVCGKTLWGTQTRHAFTHSQTLYYTSRTEAMQTGEEGGVTESEQRNFSD